MIKERTELAVLRGENNVYRVVLKRVYVCDLALGMVHHLVRTWKRWLQNHRVSYLFRRDSNCDYVRISGVLSRWTPP